MKTSELNEKKLKKDVELFFRRKEANTIVLPSQKENISKKVKQNKINELINEMKKAFKNTEEYSDAGFYVEQLSKYLL